MNSSVKDKYQKKYPHQPDASFDKPLDLFFIETEKDFKQAIQRLSSVACVAMDLEADSMFHFKEKICLIQMADRQHVYIIDPLGIRDMSPLGSLLSNPRILKILHGADYDIRSLYRDYQITIENLFDTELAARLLGYPETGLEAVLKQKFNVALEKKFQKKDWSQRPLPEDMIAYAANDVRYLIELHGLQSDELAEKKRIAWAMEECELLSKVRNHDSNDSPLFTRVKGAGRLDSRGLAALELLLEFRLDLARQKDRPPFKIIGNHALLKIAQNRPVDVNHLKTMAVLSEKQLNMYGRTIISMTARAMALPKNRLPRYPYQQLLFNDSAISPKMKHLKIWRQHKAQLLRMDAGVLMSNSILKTVAEKNPDSIDEILAINEMRNWQKKEFGAEMIAVLKNAD